jgi:L-fuconolactonase
MCSAEVKRRFVDSHAHLWDASRYPWYKFPQPGDDSFGLGLKKPFPERYSWSDYRKSLPSVDLIKWVHVSALTSPKDARAELDWLDASARAGGIPYGLIGTLDPSASLPQIETALDDAMRIPAYRGLRFLGGFEHDSAKAHAVLSMLAARNLVYDAVASPGGIRSVAKAVARHPNLTVVLEHVGWPHGITNAHISAWGSELAELADVANVYCKLSGLEMVVHRNDLSVFRRFFDEALRLFGAARCMFGSNLPIDLSYGTGAELLAIFEAVAGAQSTADAEHLYVRTAEHAYRL